MSPSTRQHPSLDTEISLHAFSQLMAPQQLKQSPPPLAESIHFITEDSEYPCYCHKRRGGFHQCNYLLSCGGH